jgi:hypothetical protein
MNRDEALQKMQEWLDGQEAGAVPGDIPEDLRTYLAAHPNDAALWEILQALEDDLRRIEREAMAAPPHLHAGIMDALRRETGLASQSRPVALRTGDGAPGSDSSEPGVDRKRVRTGRVGRIEPRAPVWPILAAAAVVVVFLGASLLVRPGFEEGTAVQPTPRPTVAFNIPDLELPSHLPSLEEPIARRGRQLADYGRTVLEQATDALQTVQSLTPPDGEDGQPVSQNPTEHREA